MAGSPRLHDSVRLSGRSAGHRAGQAARYVTRHPPRRRPTIGVFEVQDFIHAIDPPIVGGGHHTISGRRSATHTHASRLLMAGIDVKVVSERLRHSSVRSTVDTDAHVMPGQQAEAAEAAAILLTTMAPA